MVDRYLEETSIQNDLILKSRESYNTELKEKSENVRMARECGRFFF